MYRQLLSLMLIALNLALLQSCSTGSGDRIPVTTTSPKARKLFHDGMALCDRFHHDEARLKMNEALELDPEFALGYLGLACTDMRRGSQYTSLLQADEMARPFVQKSSPSLLMGISVLGKSDEDFLGRAGRLLDKVSTAERLWINGLRLSAEGNLSGALNSFRGLAMMHDRDPLAHRLLGDCYLRFNMPDSAIVSYERALDLDSAQAILYNMLGYEYQAVGRTDDAEFMFKRYAELLPDEPNPRDSYGEFLLRNGRYEESLVNYREALRLDDGFTNARVGAATNLCMLERFDDARIVLHSPQALSRKGPELSTLSLAQALTYIYEQEFDSCLDALKMRGELFDLRSDPVDAAYNYDMYGEVLSFLSRYDEAEKMFKTSVAIIRAADLPQAVKDQYELYHRVRVGLCIDIPRGQIENADKKLQQLEKVTARMTDFVSRRSFESSLHVLRGMIAFATKDFQTCAAELELVEHRTARVNYFLGRAYERLEDFESASRAYRTATKLYRLFDLSHALFYSKSEDGLIRIGRPVA